MNKVYDYYYLIIILIFAQLITYNPASAKPRTNIDPVPPKPSKLIYTPIQLPITGEVNDTLSDRDIPTGDGGFARDYAVQLMAGDRVEIDVTSENFDTVAILLNAEGKSIGKNDDGIDGSSNSLLFTKIKDSGNYIIRIQGFGETSSGEFKLKVSKLKEK